MPLLRASEVLDCILDFHAAVFADMLDKIEVIKPSHENTDYANVEKAILELSVMTEFSHLKAYAGTLTEAVCDQLNERLFYAKNFLSEYAHEHIVSPDTYPGMIRYFLIDLWNQRVSLSPKYRSN